MRYLYKQYRLKKGQTIKVYFNKATKIRLLDSREFNNFKKDKNYKYYGGFFEKSPAELKVPNDGTWTLIIEKGTYLHPVDIKGKIEIFPAPPKKFQIKN